jgi:hypothetical protein
VLAAAHFYEHLPDLLTSLNHCGKVVCVVGCVVALGPDPILYKPSCSVKATKFVKLLNKLHVWLAHFLVKVLHGLQLNSILTKFDTEAILI